MHGGEGGERGRDQSEQRAESGVVGLDTAEKRGGTKGRSPCKRLARWAFKATWGLVSTIEKEFWSEEEAGWGLHLAQ